MTLPITKTPGELPRQLTKDQPFEELCSVTAKRRTE